MIKKAVLPAAGLGTRFLPATKASPKEMLPIVDKPMIQYAVEEAESCGIREFVIITGKNKRSIEDHFDSSVALEENLKQAGKETLLDEINRHRHLAFAYIRQGRPLGLGHAIECAKPFVQNEPFVVSLSDDIIDPDDTLLADMIEIFNTYQSPVVALEEVPESEVHKYGIIKGIHVKSDLYKIESLIEKPAREESPSNLAVIGRYILTPDIFDILEEMPPGRAGEYQLTDALNGLLAKRDIYGLIYRGARYDAGDKFGFLQATINLALKRPDFSDQLKEYIVSTAEKLR